MNATQAKRARTTLRRRRSTRTRHAPCNRCGGAGGSQAWAYTGYTCYRCGGHSPMTFEIITERYYKDAADEAEDARLTQIIEDERREKFLAAQRIRDAEQKERDHAAAIREDGWRTERRAQPWIGTVGERLSFEGAVLYEKEVFTQFGGSMLILIKDEATGGVVKIFGSGITLWSIRKGQWVSGKGTIKKHETYNGSKSTVVSRAKLEILNDEHGQTTGATR